MQRYVGIGVFSLCGALSVYGAANNDKKDEKLLNKGGGVVKLLNEDKVQSFMRATFHQSHVQLATQYLNSVPSKAMLEQIHMYKDPELFKKEFIALLQVAMNGNNFFADSSQVGQKMLVHLDVLAKAKAAFCVVCLKELESLEEQTMKAARAMDKDIYDLLNQ